MSHERPKTDEERAELRAFNDERARLMMIESWLAHRKKIVGLAEKQHSDGNFGMLPGFQRQLDKVDARLAALVTSSDRIDLEKLPQLAVPGTHQNDVPQISKRPDFCGLASVWAAIRNWAR